MPTGDAGGSDASATPSPTKGASRKRRHSQTVSPTPAAAPADGATASVNDEYRDEFSLDYDEILLHKRMRLVTATEAYWHLTAKKRFYCNMTVSVPSARSSLRRS
jgi:hypothetical protein